MGRGSRKTKISEYNRLIKKKTEVASTYYLVGGSNDYELIYFLISNINIKLLIDICKFLEKNDWHSFPYVLRY